MCDQTIPFPVLATARKRRKGEKSKSRIRLESACGRLVQSPREWRAALTVGQSAQIWVTVRGDRACLVAHPSLGFEPMGRKS